VLLDVVGSFVVVGIGIDLLLEPVVDDTGGLEAEEPATLYSSSLFPAPQYSSALPAQTTAQSDRGALVLEPSIVLPQ
jgi:hypothetical protein